MKSTVITALFALVALTGQAKVHKIIKSPEFFIAFDSSYDYDNYQKSNNVFVKFVYENVTANGRIDSFIGSDGKKHYRKRFKYV